jgi:hypothetical protein
MCAVIYLLAVMDVQLPPFCFHVHPHSAVAQFIQSVSFMLLVCGLFSDGFTSSH